MKPDAGLARLALSMKNMKILLTKTTVSKLVANARFVLAMPNLRQHAFRSSTFKLYKIDFLL